MLVLRLVKTYIDMLLGGHRKVPEFVFFWGGGGCTYYECWRSITLQPKRQVALWSTGARQRVWEQESGGILGDLSETARSTKFRWTYCSE